MIAPITQSRLGLLGRSLAVCVLGAVGVAFGWTLKPGQTPTADWLLPSLILASSLLLCVEAFRNFPHAGKRGLGLAIICGATAYEAVNKLLHLAIR